MSPTRRIVQVVNYQPELPDQFRRLRDRVWPSVRDIAIAVEQVGSTSVPGLAAKPVLNLVIVIVSRSEVSEVAIRLIRLGYEHRGNLGIEDREAFSTRKNQPAHNLYVCQVTALRFGITLHCAILFARIRLISRHIRS